MTASPDAPHALVYKDGRFYVRAERIIEPSPTPPEHHADSAYCSDAQVGLPSEEEIHAAMLEAQRAFRAERDADLAKQGYWPDRSPAPLDVLARAILGLIRPAFEAKERGGVGNSDGIASPFNACCYRDECRAMESRALSAEAKLAQAVEALEPFASYHEAAEFLDDKGHPLPDDQHAGYVYLTMGAFRRAAAAMGEKT